MITSNDDNTSRIPSQNLLHQNQLAAEFQSPLQAEMALLQLEGASQALGTCLAQQLQAVGWFARDQAVGKIFSLLSFLFQTSSSCS